MSLSWSFFEQFRASFVWQMALSSDFDRDVFWMEWSLRFSLRMHQALHLNSVNIDKILFWRLIIDSFILLPAVCVCKVCIDSFVSIALSSRTLRSRFKRAPFCEFFFWAIVWTHNTVSFDVEWLLLIETYNLSRAWRTSEFSILLSRFAILRRTFLSLLTLSLSV